MISQDKHPSQDDDKSLQESNWVREQFDSDPLEQDLSGGDGIAPDSLIAASDDPFETFAFETGSISVERQNLPLAPWLLSPAPTDGYFQALSYSQLTPNKGHSIQLYNRKIAIFRLDDDRVIATDDVCPHAGAPVSNGILEGCTLLCVWHGWTFDLETGASHVNPNTPLRLYPVEIRDGEVYVGILAEEARELLTSGYPQQWDE